MNIVREVREGVLACVRKALDNAVAAGTLNIGEKVDVQIEVPREKNHGDYATNLAMVLTKQAKMPPRKIAEILVANMDFAGTEIERVEIAGPGFINFYLRNDWLYRVPGVVLQEEGRYGRTETGKGTKVQVEFVSANPTGPLHMGNARGAGIGSVLANLLEWAGFEVEREFLINDAGNQILNFGKSLEARYLQLLGHDVPFPEEGYHGKDIIEVMEEFIAEYGDRYLKVGEEERRQFFIQYALQKKVASMKEVLENFRVKYDVWFSEQTLHDSGAVMDTIRQLQERGYVYEKDEALWLRLTDFGEEKDEVLIRANGIPTYFAADIAYHRNKFERGFNWVINVWGADHHGHVSRMKGAMAALGYNPEHLDVIIMQLVRLLRNGEQVRMSKRTGEMITLSDLMEEVGVDAARYFFVMRSPDSHLDFDLDLAKEKSSENPVYYIQYGYARICSIFRQLEEKGLQMPRLEEADLSLLQEEVELNLLHKIAEFPEEIAFSAANKEPHRIARYAHDLAGLFHTFYNNCRVIGEDMELTKARLILVRAAQITLYNVLAGLLNVTAPERM